MTALQIDPDRHSRLGYNEDDDRMPTGILVRAVDEGGRSGNWDIAFLTRESLDEWLHSRGGDNPWAESVVMRMLGHR